MMRLRTALVPLALVAMLLVAGCSGLTGGVPNANAATADQPNADAAAQVDDADGQTITVGASGSVEAEPDRAVVQVAVTATGDDVSTVRRQLAENASSMRAALTEMDMIGEGSISTEYYDISRNRHRERGRDEPEYRARHSFTVTVEEPDRVGEVIVVAVENGASEVDRVQFTLTKETRRDLREEALADAMSNARTQADTIAGNSALRIDGVNTVSTAEVDVHPYRQEVALAAGDGGGGTSISSGPVTVTAQVQVVYDASSDG